jgi:hypothetical protein
MKTVLLFLFLLFPFVSFSQKEYRLFVCGDSKGKPIGENVLTRTDQLYEIMKTDSGIVIKNPALTLVNGKNWTSIYFNGEYEDTYPTEFFDCSNYYVIDFTQTGSCYFFFEVHAVDKSY